ncbi:MAG: hypothetical protein ACQEQV_03580 [Fibrobacterota bacterium]
MSSINPRTGKRMGKFLWREDKSERDQYIQDIQRRIQSGYYSSGNVVSGIVDELAPHVSESMGIDPTG